MMKRIYLILLLLASYPSIAAMQAVNEDELRSLTAQKGIDIDINYKATIGRVYFSDNGGNFLNVRNISVDTDGDNHGISDRPINIKTQLISRGKFSGLGLDITGINDIDISFEQLNVNADAGSGSVASQLSSYGGLSLTNISDNGGASDLAIYADGASGTEGIRLEATLSKHFSLNFGYTDYGSNQGSTADDHSLTTDIILNDFTSETSVGIVSGNNADGVDVGGLKLGVISMGGDITLSSIRAGDQAGTMGRIVMDNLYVSPESYLTVQGK